MFDNDRELRAVFTPRAAERAAQISERDVLARLPAGVRHLDWTYDAVGLFDCAGLLHAGPCESGAGRFAPAPTLDTVRTLATVLPSVALALYRDDWVGLRTYRHAAETKATAMARGRNPTLTPILPFWVHVHDCQFPRAQFCWVTSIAGCLVDCRITLPIRDVACLGAFEVRYGRPAARRGGIVSVGRDGFRPTGAGRIGGFDSLRLAGGSREAPGSSLLYWRVEHACTQPTIAVLIDVIQGAQDQAA